MGIILFQLFINYIFYTFYDAGAWKWYRIAAIFAFPAFTVIFLFLHYLSVNIYTYAPAEISFDQQSFILNSILHSFIAVIIQLVVLYKADKIHQLVIGINKKLGTAFI